MDNVKHEYTVYSIYYILVYSCLYIDRCERYVK